MKKIIIASALWVILFMPVMSIADTLESNPNASAYGKVSTTAGITATATNGGTASLISAVTQADSSTSIKTSAFSGSYNISSADTTSPGGSTSSSAGTFNGSSTSAAAVTTGAVNVQILSVAGTITTNSVVVGK